MEKQVKTISTHQSNSQWLDIAETSSVIVSLGSSIAAIFFEKIFLASIPLSICVALNLVNRNRILSLTRTESKNVIAELTQQNQDNYSQLSQQLAKLQQSSDNQLAKSQNDRNILSKQINQLNTDLNKRTQELKQQDEGLATKVEYLNQIESFTRAIQSSPNSAELYCQRGVSYQQMVKQERAIEDYTKAIELDPSSALAYHNRGIVNSDLGKRKTAVEDLRKAAKFYFDRGDLDNYQKTRNMSQALHELNYSSGDQDSNKVLASSLFS